MTMLHVVKLTLGVQATEPVASLKPQNERRMDSAGEMNFFAENRDPALAVSSVLMRVVAYAERLYGPIVIGGDPAPADRPRLVKPGEGTDG